MGTCNSVRQWQPGQRRSGLGKAGPGRCCWQRAQGVHPGPAEGVPARLRGPDAGGGDLGRESGFGPPGASRGGEGGGGGGGRGRAPVSPDRVVLRGYRLRAVLGLGGSGKARGVSGLNGESPTLRGLLGTHVQAPGRSARAVAVRPLPDRRAPSARARPLGRCSPAGGRGRSQAGSSCPTPGRGRTLRSRRSPAGVCGAPRPGRRGGGLHCDAGRGALTSQSPFLPSGTSSRLGLPGTPRRSEPGLEGLCHGASALGRAGSPQSDPGAGGGGKQPRGGVQEKEPVIPGDAQTSRGAPGRAATPGLARGRGRSRDLAHTGFGSGDGEDR